MTGPGYDFGDEDVVSRALFSWDASDRRLRARTRQPLTLVRSTLKTRLDDAGRVLLAAPYAPAWQMDDDATNGIFDSLGLLLEPARTNVVLWNRDLTNAAWTKANCTAAKDQVGADGVVNAASRLTATAANATCLQAITLGSSARWLVARVRRLVGAGTIQMTMDNGATWTALAGLMTAGFVRVGIPTQTLANPTVGFRIVTSGDSIAVDFVQNEGSAKFGTSDIPTTTAAVTRNRDALSATLQCLTALPDQLTLYGAIHRADWMDASGDLGYTPYAGTFGNAAARIEAYFKQTTRQLAVKLSDATGTSQEAVQNIPGGNVIRFAAHLKGLLTTGGQVALDVGTGFGAFSSAVATVPSLSTTDVTLGDAAHAVGSTLAASLRTMRLLPNLHTRALAAGYY
ncbi:MAG: hypothetical protein HOP28_12165 [Gemmatimonadales bacterium]|nr:hypothetical protein [Gemmatimonadales bacterium]